jgi:hypothetical protein
MQPNELRIGNWVLKQRTKSKGDTQIYHDPTLIDSIFIDGVNMEWNYELSDYISNNIISPIPLTPEILERCGFHKDSLGICGILFGEPYKKGSVSIIITPSSGLTNILTGTGIGILKYDSIFLPNPTLYIHQLQNLYFALTGEELNYKP